MQNSSKNSKNKYTNWGQVFASAKPHTTENLTRPEERLHTCDPFYIKMITSNKPKK